MFEMVGGQIVTVGVQIRPIKQIVEIHSITWLKCAKELLGELNLIGERQSISSKYNLLEIFDKKFKKLDRILDDTTRSLALHVDYCYYC